MSTDKGIVPETDEPEDMAAAEERLQMEERWEFEDMTIRNMEWAAKFLTRALVHYNKTWGSVINAWEGTQPNLVNALEDLEHALDGAPGFDERTDLNRVWVHVTEEDIANGINPDPPRQTWNERPIELAASRAGLGRCSMVTSAWSFRIHSPGSPSGRGCVRRLSNSPGPRSPSRLSGQRTRKRTEAGSVDRLTTRNAAQGRPGCPWAAFLSLPYPKPYRQSFEGVHGAGWTLDTRTPIDGCRLTGWGGLYYGPWFTLAAGVSRKGWAACSLDYCTPPAMNGGRACEPE